MGEIARMTGAVGRIVLTFAAAAGLTLAPVKAQDDPVAGLANAICAAPDPECVDDRIECVRHR
ncbi:MAG: hypothetical protein HC794_10725 [Nitrospiraceae bacterium]|nr:hypothetical protein [Nitrospiraceae bacterium]